MLERPTPLLQRVKNRFANMRRQPSLAAALIAQRSVNPQAISFSNVIHLSHVIHSQMPRWPGDPPAIFEPVASVAQDGYFLRHFALGEHSATHINAPNTFFPGGAGVDAYPADALVAPAVVIDLRRPCAADPDYALTQADVLAWEAQHGRIPPGRIVLLYTGWQEKWDDPHAFFNPDVGGGMHFPGFAGETTRFLLDARQIAGVGIDTHGADPGQDGAYATNRQVLERQGLVLENLTNLHQLPAVGATLVIGVLRLQGGSGSPAAVMAFVP